MQGNSITSLKEFLTSWHNNSKYFDMLRIMAQLSRLFSDNIIPYLDYRLAENLFCKYFSAINDARACTAYDARLNKVGIGIKTFILREDRTHNFYSIEKIAEFNKLKPKLQDLKGYELAYKISEFRNARIEFANNVYDVSENQYHIVGRLPGQLLLFNSPYDFVDLKTIKVLNDSDTSISFNDGKNNYTFNKSKSVLLKKFMVPSDNKQIDVDILDDPLSLIEEIFAKKDSVLLHSDKAPLVKGYDYVILPLYSVRNNIKYVAEKSGLNQWNASGRVRNEDEIYIPIPSYIQKNFCNFFPNRDCPFPLLLPNGKIIDAKVCQDGGKALMSNPNRVLGNYILRQALKKKPGELVTIEDLNRYGFDSVCIEKQYSKLQSTYIYKLYFTNTYGNYDEFSSES